MKLTISSLIAGLALLGTASATFHMEVQEKCETFSNGFTDCYQYRAVMTEDNGRVTPTTIREGCQLWLQFPDIVEFCADFHQYRAHFRYRGKEKRCLKKTSSSQITVKGYSKPHTNSVFDEVPCTW